MRKFGKSHCYIEIIMLKCKEVDIDMCRGCETMGLFKKKQVSRFYLLRNNDLVVYINNQGAELMSVKDTARKTEYIWNGEKNYMLK